MAPENGFKNYFISN